MRMNIQFAGLALALSCFAGLATAETGAVAGEITLLTGKATASNDDGDVRVLARGDQVYSGEVISSGAGSYVNLKFNDGGLILLRPKTRFQIEEYKYAATAEPAKPVSLVEPAPQAAAAPKPATPVASASPGAATGTGSRAFFRLLKGGFRAVSGLIGHDDQNQYRVSTPVATIGIRGTDYFAEIIDASFAKDPVLRANLPEGANPEGGVYFQQFEGSTVITNNNGKQFLLGKGSSLVTLKGGNQVSVPEAAKIKADPPPSPKDANCKGG